MTNHGSMTDGFPPGARLARSPDALEAEVGGDVVLLNMATGFFHQLNAVGSYVWRSLAEPQTIDDLCAKALADFRADHAQCRRDIGAFVQELHGSGLIRVDS